MSEYDVYRRQILTSKDGPRTEKIKLVVMAIDHNIDLYSYSNEAERDN